MTIQWFIFLFSVNLAPLTFSSLEPLLALKTAWRISHPFLRQFGAPDGFFPGAPAYTWTCMAPLSSLSPSILRPWRFLPWSLCLHLKLHGASFDLFSVNLVPLTFSLLEPLLALETACRPSRSFLSQFSASDVFFPEAPACTWNCMAPLSSFSPSIWRPWRFLPWSPCLHLKLHDAPLILFSVNLLPLTFSSLEPLLALETAWRPSCYIDLTFFPSFFFLAPSFFPFFFLIPFFSPFFPLFSPLSFFPFPFFFLFRAPLVTPGGPGPQSPPKIRPCHCILIPRAQPEVVFFWCQDSNESPLFFSL